MRVQQAVHEQLGATTRHKQLAAEPAAAGSIPGRAFRD